MTPGPLRTIAGIVLVMAARWTVWVPAAHAQGADAGLDDGTCPRTWDPPGPSGRRGAEAAPSPEEATSILTCNGEPKDDTLKLTVSGAGDAVPCLRTIPEDYAVVVCTPPGDTVAVDLGDPVVGIIRGGGGNSKSFQAVQQDSGLVCHPAFTQLKNFSDATFTVREGQNLVAKAKIKLLHRYWINLGIGVILGAPGVTTYSVANKTIQENLSGFDVSYDAMFHIYPAGARVFDYEYDRWYRRVSLVVGFPISGSITGVFAGVGIELISGATLVVGVQPRRVAKLRPGVVVGAMNGDAGIPTDMVWDGAFFAAGLSFDTNVARAIVAALK